MKNQKLYECEAITQLIFENDIPDQKTLYKISNTLNFSKSFKLNGIRYHVRSAAEVMKPFGESEGIIVDYYCVTECDENPFSNEANDKIDIIIGSLMLKCESQLKKFGNKLAKKYDTSFSVGTN